MSCILEFLGENIAGVDDARDMADVYITIDDGFVDLAFAEIHVFHALVCEGGRPGDTCFVVVVNGDAAEGIGHAKILGTEFDMEKFFGAFIGGHDFGLARALGSLILSNDAPGDGTAASTDEVARERPKFEEFERGSVRNRVAKLTTPVCIAEGSELMDL